MTLGLDSAAFEKGADRSIKKMDAVERAGFRTGRAIRGIGTIAAGAAVALAGMFTTKMIKDGLDYAASIGEVASQLGVTTRELQAYRYAATQVNLTQEEIEKGLAKLTLSIGKAGSGAKAESHSFESLGISIRDAEGNIRPTGEVLLDLADRLQAIPDPAQRAAAAYAVLGRQGQKLIPLLEGGSAGLKQFAADADEAGMIIADGDIAKADETADKIETLTSALKVDFSREVAKNADSILLIVSALAKLIGWLTKAGGAYINFFRKVGTVYGQVIQQGAESGGLIGWAMGGVRRRLMAMGLRAKPKVETPEATATGAGPDLDSLFDTSGGRSGGSGRNETARIREQLADLRQDIKDTFDTRILPRATEQAEDLRRKLEELAEDARKAGVPMAQFAGEVAGLKAEIDALEAEGLEKEAKDFAAAVMDAGRAVDALDRSSMTPLAAKLTSITDRFDDMKRSVRDQIEENRLLADSNDTARRAMADLEEMLGQLERAHQKATDAALAQYQAEQGLRDLAADEAALGIAIDTQALRRARGDVGPATGQEHQLRETEEQLRAERLRALSQLRAMEADLAEAQLDGDAEEARRLQGLISMQRDYYDLVSETTAEQIVQSQRLQDTYSDFTEGLSDALYDMVAQFDFSLRAIADVFLQALNQQFLRPAADGAASWVGNTLKTLFAGGFAGGGRIPRGQWGIVGEEGPEPIFAADGPLRVMPNDTLGGARGDTINITVAGAMSDRDARRTGAQIALGIQGRQAAARRSGLAGSAGK